MNIQCGRNTENLKPSFQEMWRKIDAKGLNYRRTAAWFLIMTLKPIYKMNPFTVGNVKLLTELLI